MKKRHVLNFFLFAAIAWSVLFFLMVATENVPWWLR